MLVPASGKLAVVSGVIVLSLMATTAPGSSAGSPRCRSICGASARRTRCGRTSAVPIEQPVDVTDLVNARTDDCLMFNIRLGGDKPDFDGNVFQAAGTHGVKAASMENLIEHRPYLDMIPEPASTGLAVLGGLAVLWWGRRARPGPTGSAPPCGPQGFGLWGSGSDLVDTRGTPIYSPRAMFSPPPADLPTVSTIQTRAVAASLPPER